MKFPKMPCWSCIATYILSAPPILAYLMYRRYKHDVGFRKALDELGGALEAVKKIEILYDNKVPATTGPQAVHDSQHVPDDPGGGSTSRP